MDSLVSIFLLTCLLSLSTAQVPGPVQNLVINDIQQWGFTAAWNPPATGNTAELYNMTITNTNTNDVYERSLLPNTDGSYEIDHLYDDTTYTFSVVAVNSDDQGGSPVENTGINIPSCQLCLSSENSGPNYFQLMFPATGVNTTLSGTSVDASTQLSGTQRTIRSTYTSTFFLGLQGGLLYELQMTDSNTQDIVYSSRYRTEPHPVTNLLLSPDSSTSVQVTYEQPIGTQYHKYDGFRIRYGTDGQEVQDGQERFVGSNDTSVVIDGLQAGISYTIEVQTYSGELADHKYSTPATGDITLEQLNSEELRLQTRTSTSIFVSLGNTTRPEVIGFVLRITFQEGDAIDSKTVGLGDVLAVEFSDLIPGTNYTVYLLVEVEGQWDTTVHSLDVTTLPGTPGRVYCDYNTQSLLEIVWVATQEGNFDGYAISTQTNDGEEIPLESVGKDEQLQATADYLMDDTTYTIIVRSTLGDLRGEPATVACRTSAQFLKVSTSTSTSGGQDLFLDWSDFGPEFSYEVEFTPQEGTPSSPIFLDTMQLILRNLSPGTAYHFTLFGVFEFGRLQITGLTFVLAPLPVEQVIIVLRRPTSFTIQITLPRRGRYRFLRLRVRRRSQGLDAGPDGDEFLIPTDACPEYTFNNLLPDTDYAVDVNTVAEDGRTESSPSTMDVTTPPMEEADVSFNGVTTTSISFSWGMVSADTNGPFDFYLLNLKNELSIDIHNVQVNTSETREHTFSGLMPGKLYRVELIVNSFRQRSAAMYTRPDKPTNIMLSDLTTTSLTLDWQAPLTSYQGFRLCWAYGETNSLELGPAVMERTLSDLEAGAEYLVSLAAVIGTGIDQITSEKFTTIVTLVSSAELHVNITSFNTTAVSIVWGTDITLLDVSSYVVSYWETANNGSVQDITVDDPSQTDYTIDGLVPGTQYSFMVDSLGTVRAVTYIIATQYTNPETVAEIRVIPSYTSSVRLEWDRPEGNLDSYIFHYNVTQGTIVGAPLQLDVAINDTAETLTYLLEGLEKDSSSDFVSLEVLVTTVAGAGEDQVESLQQVVKELDVNVVTVTILSPNLNTIHAQVMSSISDDLNSITTALYIDGMVTRSTSSDCMNVDCTAFTVSIDMLNSSTLYTLYASVEQYSGREVVPLLTKAATKLESAVDPQFTSIGRDFVVLTWVSPAGRISSYKISYYPVSDTPKPIDVVQAAAESNVLRVDDLYEGMNYSFTVVSLLEVEAGYQAMGAPVEVFAVVGVLGSLNITAFDETSISIEWEQVDVEEYILSYDALEGGSGNVTVQSTDSNSYTFTDLTPGTQYTIGVQPGIYTALEETQFTVPNPPTNLRTMIVAAHSITISWDPPSEGGSDTYVITYNVTGGQPPSPHTVSSSETSVTFRNLTPLTEYFFTIMNIWESLPSRSELTGATTSAQTLSLAVTPQDNTEFTVSWEDLDTKAFDKYCVRYKPYKAQANRQQESFPVDRSIRSARFYGLDPGQEYTVYVTSCSLFSEATNHASERISFRLDPAAIAEMRIMNGSLGSRAVTLEWDQPEGIRGLYEVTLDPADEGSVDGDELPVNITGVMTSIEILNLAAGKGYTVGITAISGDKRSEDTTFLFYTYELPATVDVRETTTTTINLVWLTTDLNSLAFFISYKPAHETQQTQRTLSVSPEIVYAEYTLDSLTAGELYTIRIQNGDNDFNVEITQRTRPNAITQLLSSLTTSTNITVNWNSAPGVVSYYEVAYDPPNGKSPRRTYVRADEPCTLTLSGLFPDSKYTVTVVTWSGTGEDATSSTPVSVMFNTDEGLEGELKVTDFTSDSISVEWSEVVSIDFENYRLQATPEGEGSPIVAEIPPEGPRMHTFENLIPGVRYTINNILQGSDPVVTRTVSQRTRPNPVSGLTVVSLTPQSITVTWQQATGSFNDYVVTYTLSDEPMMVIYADRIPSDGTRVSVIDGLLPDTSYVVTVYTSSGTNADQTTSTEEFVQARTSAACSPLIFLNASFPDGREGDVVDSSETCPIYTTLGGTPIGRAECVQNTASGELAWNITMYLNDCGPLRETNEVVDEIIEKGVTNETVIEVLEVVIVVTDMELDERDIVNIANIISNSTALQSGDPEITTLTATIISNFAERDEDELSAVEENTGAITQILESFEEQLNNLDISDGQSYTALEMNVAVQVTSVEPVNFLSGLTVSASSTSSDLRQTDITLNDGDSIVQEEILTGTRVSIPSSVLNDLSSEDGSESGVRVALTVFSTPSLFASKHIRGTNAGQSSFNRTVNSLVIGLTLGRQKLVTLGENIVFKYTPLQSGFRDPECVFWDFEDTLDWSSRGCRKIPSSGSVQDSGITCSCDHLTNFAVLMDIYYERVEALRIISIIGCAISIVCLVIILITYLSNKNLHVHQSQKIFMCLCGTLLGLYLTFLIMSALDRHPDYPEVTPVPCGILAALVHFFTLSSMAWMGVEGINTYLIVVRVFDAYIPRFMLKASIVAWGVSGLIVLLTGLASQGNYAATDYCFLQKWPSVGGLLIPIAIILLANIVIFSLVVRRLIKSANVASNSDAAGTNRKASIERIKNAVSVLLLLGLTWVTGYLTLIDTTSQVTQTLFIVFNSLQGFFIFILYCARNPVVRAYWAKVCGCGQDSSRTSTRANQGTSQGISLTKTKSTSENDHDYENPSFDENKEYTDLDFSQGKKGGDPTKPTSAAGKQYTDLDFSKIEKGGDSTKSVDYENPSFDGKEDVDPAYEVCII